MAETSPQIDEEKQTKRESNKETILSAENAGEVLEEYRRSIEGARSYNKAGLQTAVADKLHQLGEEEKSFEFTLLASQTENAESSRRSVEASGEIAMDVGKSSNKMLESSENLKSSIGRMGEGMEEFRITGSKISSAGSQIEQAARSIEQSSHRMQG